MAIIWNEVKRNETPDFLSTIEDRLRRSGVLALIRGAALEDMEHHYGQSRQGSDGPVGSNDKGEEPFSDDV